MISELNAGSDLKAGSDEEDQYADSDDDGNEEDYYYNDRLIKRLSAEMIKQSGEANEEKDGSDDDDDISEYSEQLPTIDEGPEEDTISLEGNQGEHEDEEDEEDDEIDAFEGNQQENDSETFSDSEEGEEDSETDEEEITVADGEEDSEAVVLDRDDGKTTVNTEGNKARRDSSLDVDVDEDLFSDSEEDYSSVTESEEDYSPGMDSEEVDDSIDHEDKSTDDLENNIKDDGHPITARRMSKRASYISNASKNNMFYDKSKLQPSQSIRSKAQSIRSVRSGSSRIGNDSESMYSQSETGVTSVGDADADSESENEYETNSNKRKKTIPVARNKKTTIPPISMIPDLPEDMYDMNMDETEIPKAENMSIRSGKLSISFRRKQESQGRKVPPRLQSGTSFQDMRDMQTPLHSASSIASF